MKRTSLLTAALAATAMVAAAAPASAQLPGRNGAVTWTFIGVAHVGPCFNDQISSEAAGGIAWAKGGATMAASVFNHEVGGPRLLLVDVATCAEREISDIDFESTASWSPDGKQLAVQLNERIHVINADGSYVRQLARGTDPSWSPDGRTVAYSTAEGIRTVPATGGSSKLWEGGASDPDYSPDGKRIGYLEGGRIRTATASTSSSTVTTPISATSFTWSPDGRQFAFASPKGAVVVANTTGLITSRLAEPAGPGAEDDNDDLAWQPLP